MNQRSIRSINVHYCLIHLVYWLAYTVNITFASKYLLDRGFTNTVIGFLLAGGNIGSVVIQELLATFLDRHPNVNGGRLFSAFYALGIAICALLQFAPLSMSAVAVLMIPSVAVYQSGGFIVTVQAIRLRRDHYDVNYGLARGVGSFAYAPFTIIVGALVARFGTGYLKLIEMAIYVVLIAITLAFPEPQSRVDPSAIREPERHGTFIEFIGKYRLFFLYFVGGFLCFFAHAQVVYFMYQCLEPIGGGSSEMGIAVAISAVTESVVMMLCVPLVNRYPLRRLLQFCAFMFALKQVVLMLATNIPVFYIGQILQFGTYGIYTPCAVVLCSRVMEPRDMFRGQSMVTIVPLLATILSSMAGGVVLDTIGVRGVHMLSAACSVCGAVIMIAALQSRSFRIRNDTPNAD